MRSISLTIGVVAILFIAVAIAFAIGNLLILVQIPYSLWFTQLPDHKGASILFEMIKDPVILLAIGWGTFLLAKWIERYDTDESDPDGVTGISEDTQC